MASAKPAPRARSLPDVPRRVLIIAVGLTGSVLLAATIIWGISRMGPRSVPLIEADGRPFRVRPETLPPQPTTPAATERTAQRPDQARLAPAPEAPRTDALRQQMQPPAPAPTAGPAPAGASASPATANAAPAPATTAGASPPTAARNGAPTAAPRGPAPAAAAPASAATAAPAAPAPRPASAATPGRSQVQFTATTSEDAAKAEWERLKRRVPELAALQPRIIRVEREGKPPIWRLRVATADAAAARALCEQARARNAQCVPV